MRRAADGWHAVLRIGTVNHRVWLKDEPSIGHRYAAKLPFDENLPPRAHAARRLWRALNGRAAGPAFHELSKQRRDRLRQVARALDARHAGSSYRVIALALLGKKSVPKQAWKTHDSRSLIIRLVHDGFSLMRGGYCRLLRSGRRNK
ncbi:MULTISPECIES: DUF2285 domain-containing protein [Bradyrhizobium]|nr:MULTISPECIES: DUF2285 domain-containing protein [Bradyrhizobium]MCG2645446.1 DUF2285 domain-containing protein [Bradyrhizobium zhengyangense]MDN4988700.1 DUF2285 domain-containing protein [Bradyrhizobium sp. WYCCWR 13022]MDN5006239.1 DUF2285 domain-containing protein [Bradyrhizobium sp. WYCCWR 12677]MDT4737797.1 DUF2285 domain-containing protein [Bradyrhizobium sp. WYCCWR 12699]